MTTARSRSMISAVGAHGVTIVPMPSGVKTSSSRACWIRPSRMWAWATPPRSASAHEISFGRMPPSIAGAFQHLLELGQVHPRHQRVGIGLVTPDPFDIGQVDQLLRPEGPGQGPGGGVGVEVVDVAILPCRRAGR